MRHAARDGGSGKGNQQRKNHLSNFGIAFAVSIITLPSSIHNPFEKLER
jgi:hypothetical protein